MIDYNDVYHGDCIDVLKEVDDFSVDLAIIDPPYFKVINEKFDYQWRTKTEYEKWLLDRLAHVAMKLRIGGTIYLFGYFRSLAFIPNYLDIYGLEVREMIVIDKGMRAVSGRATKKYKMFPNVTECILMMTKDNKQWFRDHVRDRYFFIKHMGWNAKRINELLGVKSNGGGMWSIYTGRNVCAQFPTKEHYDIIKKEIMPTLPPYETVAQTFNPQVGLTNVWSDINFYERVRRHPTEKPLKLVERLVLASTNEGDVVLDPMCGSGNVALSCLQHNRKFICIEQDEKYYSITKEKISHPNK